MGLSERGMMDEQHRPLVLVVEDDRVSREALGTLLTQWGYEPTSAANVAEGILKLDENPAAVLLDLMLPDGLGVRLLRGIRELDFPVKIAVITGATDPELLASVHGLRPDVFFQKPVDVPSLKDWLVRTTKLPRR